MILCLDFPSIRCFSCAAKIEEVIRKCTTVKIEKCATDIIEKRIYIETSDTESEAETLRRLQDHLKKNNIKSSKTTSVLAHTIEGGFGLLVGAALMILCMAMPALPLVVTTLLTGFSSLYTLFLGRESYQEAFNSLKHFKSLTMDTLFSISTLTVISVSIASLFVPWLPAMSASGLMIFGFRHIGKAIEKSIRRRIVNRLLFKPQAEQVVNRKIQESNSDDWELISINTLNPGDIIKVDAEKTLPVDGICLNESTTVYKTILDGSLLPSSVVSGDNLLGGMKSCYSIEMKVTKTVNNSYPALLDRKLANALTERAPIEDSTNKILKYLVPSVLVLSVLSGIVTGIFAGPAMAIQCATAVLVSACPCTLGFITPLAMRIGMSRALDNGISFNNPKAIQEISTINTVVFDLNGTLTMGAPVVEKSFVVTSDATVFYKYIAALEKDVEQPIGRALFQYAQNICKEPLMNIDIIDTSHHSGISATIQNEKCFLGNKEFMMINNISLPDTPKQSKNHGHTIYLAIENKIIGWVQLHDKLRPDAERTIQSLQESGVSVHICTGSDKKTAHYYGSLLKIPEENIVSDCIGASDDPDRLTKGRYIDSLKRSNKKVAMIGDAANDAVAMAKSDFGILIHSEPCLSAENNTGASVIGTSLLPIAAGFSIAKQTMQNIRQSLIFSFIYNAVTLTTAAGALLSFGIALSPPVGAALMITQMVLLLITQCRMKYQKPLTCATPSNTIKFSSQKIMHENGIDVQHLAKPSKAVDVSYKNEITPIFATPFQDPILVPRQGAIKNSQNLR